MSNRTIGRSEVEALAHECVNNMGDNFWDWKHFNGAADGYANPETAARESVEGSIVRICERFGIRVLGDDS